jgi:hypothetical protein
VGGQPATTFSVTVDRNIDGGLGCFDNGSCEGFYERNEARYAVIETPYGLVVAGMRSFSDNPRASEWLAQFDGVLDSMRVGDDRDPDPGPAARTELSGVWRTTLTPAAIEQELARAGLGRHLDRALAELPRDADSRWTVELWIDGADVRASVITQDGVPNMVDTRSYTWDGSRLTLTGGDGAYVTVLEVDRAGGALRLTPVSISGPAYDGVPIEVFERMLYTSAPFVRAS